MRFVRVLVVLALILSVLGNVLLYTKFNSKRAIFSVNGEGVSRRDLDNHLEQQGGIPAKAQFVERMLVSQEAKAQGVLPTTQEVEDEYNKRREENWQFARQVEFNPWIAGEAKKQIQQDLAKIRLLAKDVPVTEEDMQEEYRQNAARYDTPQKAKVNLAVIMNAGLVGDIKQMLSKKDPPFSPADILSQYRTGVTFLGHNNVFTFLQPFGKSQVNADVFKLKKGDVRQFPPGEFARQGAKAILVRMQEVIPGKKADLNDAKTKEKLRFSVASRRWAPWQEKLSKLWAAAKFNSENPDDKRSIEAALFPEQARAEQSKQQ